MEENQKQNILSHLLEEDKERDYKLEEKVDELQKSVNEMKENLMKVVEMISAYDITSIMGCWWSWATCTH